MAGLYESIQIVSALVNSGQTIDFSVGSRANGPFRVTDFDWAPKIVGDAPGKTQGSGSWPTWRDVRLLEIQMEGRIVGSSPSDYWEHREALSKAVVPPPNFDRYYRRHGTMNVGLPHVGTVWAYINLVDFSMPVSHAEGSSSKFAFTWHADLGYWTSGSTPIAL